MRLCVSKKVCETRAQIVLASVPSAAILPILPVTIVVARATMINNPVLIAAMGTLLVGTAVGLLVCLPVAMALTRNLDR